VQKYFILFSKMGGQKPEVIELLDSSSSLMSPPPKSKYNNYFEIDDKSSEEETNSQLAGFGSFRDAREKLLKIVGKSSTASTIPRYNNHSEFPNSVAPNLLQRNSSESQKEEIEFHTGLSQEYQSLTFSNVIEKKRVKVKGDALPEIPHSVKDILKKEEMDELSILLNVEWIIDNSINEEVKYIFWKRCYENQTPYNHVVALVEIEGIFKLIESREFNRLFSKIFQFCHQRHKFLLLLGVRKYIQKLQTQENRHFKKLLANNKTLTPERMNRPNWIDLEQELYIAAVEESIQITIVPDWQLGSHLVEMTKCIAWEPHSQLQKEELGNAMGATDVHTGQTLADTWRQMLRVIPSVSDITAGLIVDKYPTIQHLRQDFVANGPNVLGDLQLSNRRLGNALSHRIYMVLMGNDSSTLIRQ
jgi:hypothetical protein